MKADTLLVLMNAHHETVPFRLPAQRGEEFPLEGRSLAVFRLKRRR